MMIAECSLHIPRFQDNRPFRRHGVRRVDAEVHEDLADVGGNRLDIPQFTIQLAADIDPGIDQMLEKRGDFLQAVIQRKDLSGCAIRLPYVIEKLSNHLHAALGGAFGVKQTASAGVFWSDFRECQGHTAPDAGQQVVEIMRDAAGKKSDRFQFLKLVQLVFGDLLSNEFFTSSLFHED